MDEISTSFCFICLLYLANERGLKIEVDGAVEADEKIVSTGDNKIGNLWDLKVSVVLYLCDVSLTTSVRVSISIRYIEILLPHLLHRTFDLRLS